MSLRVGNWCDQGCCLQKERKDEHGNNPKDSASVLWTNKAGKIEMFKRHSFYTYKV
jgi:hypothetical protein